MAEKKPLLLETIRIEDGKALNLAYHQKRFDASRKAHFIHPSPLLLSEIIKPPHKTGLWRCRICYTDTLQSIEYLPYRPKKIEKLKIVASSLSYPYKYADREIFETLQRTYTDYDDILIEKEGLLTDTTIANIAFYDGTQWLTPNMPLLKGTMREKLIEEGFLNPHPITKKDIGAYTHVALMNAMLGFTILNRVEIT